MTGTSSSIGGNIGGWSGTSGVGMDCIAATVWLIEVVRIGGFLPLFYGRKGNRGYEEDWMFGEAERVG